MSEKNEIIFISEYAADKIAFGRQDFFQISVGIKSYNSDDVPYILKSKYDEQAAEIEKLKAELEKVKDENEWISVEDRLPEDTNRGLNVPVIIYRSDECMFGAFYEHDTKEFQTDEGLTYGLVTHWKPLPQPPTK